MVCTVVTFFKAALPMGESKPSPRDGTINNCLAKCNALQQSVYTSKWEIHGALAQLHVLHSELANMFVHEDGGYRWFMFIPSPRLSLRGCAKPCRPASSRLPRARAQRRAGPCSSCGRAANPGPSSMMQGRTFLTNQVYYIYNTYIMYALLFQRKI